jgi:LAS superfamily LD-carboxypeptidase LdcB
MVRDMKAAGLPISAFSTYRSMERQQSLCDGDRGGCSRGVYHSQAKPGTSNHQMGLAIDFSGMGTHAAAGTACASASTSPVWKWLKAHAAHYGFHQYAAEPWHWEAASGC